jgi:hypothetical protein
LKVTDENSRIPDPDPLVRGTDPRIKICTNMTRIRNIYFGKSDLDPHRSLAERRVADPHHFNADPDSTSYFNAGPNQDLAFHFLGPAFTLMRIWILPPKICGSGSATLPKRKMTIVKLFKNNSRKASRKAKLRPVKKFHQQRKRVTIPGKYRDRRRPHTPHSDP